MTDRRAEAWTSDQAYEPYVGPCSRVVAPRLLHALAAGPPGGDVVRRRVRYRRTGARAWRPSIPSGARGRPVRGVPRRGQATHW
ncbi:MAG: hypothetical protein V7646_6138 [Pseudonocardia sp.]